MDICVGQNKSQVHQYLSISILQTILPVINHLQGVLMFMSFLSMTLYKRLVCNFLVSGHSHICPDRFESHVKRSFGANNLYLPARMVENINTIRTVSAEFMDHNDPKRPMFTDTLNKKEISIDQISIKFITLCIE
jgi:hypothetical protein